VSYVRSYGLDIPQLDKLLAAGRAEFDAVKRKAVYTELQQVFLEQAPMVGLCFRAQGYAMTRQVTGFRNLPGALTFYSGTTLEQTSTG
jgi:peptide/nickel transport system substrate-binding protein